MLGKNKKPVSITHQHLMGEWDFVKNGMVRPEGLTFGSRKRVWWVCNKCQHSWETRLNSRTGNLPTGCPRCNGKVISKERNVFSMRPNLCKEWNYVKNSPYTPENVFYGTDKKFWWKCYKCGFEWESSPKNRTLKNSGCPICTRRITSSINSIVDNFPILVQEWDKDKNSELKIETLSYGSSKRVWWKCRYCSYRWKTSINSRVRNENITSCPKCSNGPVSKISQEWLDQMGVQKEFREYRIDIGSSFIRVDGFDPKTNTVYEFLGDFWHGNPEVFNQEDVNVVNKKTYGQLYCETLERIKLLEEKGFTVVYVWETDFKKEYIK